MKVYAVVTTAPEHLVDTLLNEGDIASGECIYRIGDRRIVRVTTPHIAERMTRHLIMSGYSVTVLAQTVEGL